MKNQKSGAIVNISSDIAFSGGENRSAYAAAKAGILGLTRTLALELAPAGVRVNAVAPGRIETAKVRSHYTDAEWEKSNERIPLGHPGAVEDVAEAVAYLASDAAKHVTGTDDACERREDHALTLSPTFNRKQKSQIPIARISGLLLQTKLNDDGELQNPNWGF